MGWIKLVAFLTLVSVIGCGKPKVEIPTAPLTEEQKAAIKAEDAKVAEQESHGKRK